MHLVLSSWGCQCLLCLPVLEICKTKMAGHEISMLKKLLDLLTVIGLIRMCMSQLQLKLITNYVVCVLNFVHQCQSGLCCSYPMQFIDISLSSSFELWFMYIALICLTYKAPKVLPQVYQTIMQNRRCHYYRLSKSKLYMCHSVKPYHDVFYTLLNKYHKTTLHTCGNHVWFV